MQQLFSHFCFHGILMYVTFLFFIIGNVQNKVYPVVQILIDLLPAISTRDLFVVMNFHIYFSLQQQQKLFPPIFFLSFNLFSLHGAVFGLAR